MTIFCVVLFILQHSCMHCTTPGMHSKRFYYHFCMFAFIMNYIVCILLLINYMFQIHCLKSQCFVTINGFSPPQSSIIAIGCFTVLCIQACEPRAVKLRHVRNIIQLISLNRNFRKWVGCEALAPIQDNGSLWYLSKQSLSCMGAKVNPFPEIPINRIPIK